MTANQTDKSSVLKLSGICAFIAGICYFIIVILALSAPQSVASYVVSEQYFIDFLSYKYRFIFLKGLMAIANAAFIGVVIGFYRLCRPTMVGMMLWLSILIQILFGPMGKQDI